MGLLKDCPRVRRPPRPGGARPPTPLSFPVPPHHSTHPRDRATARRKAPSIPKAVLTTKVDPSYDDLPEERYHFPRTYLNAARAALGDWIVYYEPRRTSARLSSTGGRQSYFATARIVRVDGDPHRDDHYYAYVEDYLEFDRPVPFREDGLFYESRLRKEDGSVNKGMFGRSVRLPPDTSGAPCTLLSPREAPRHSAGNQAVLPPSACPRPPSHRISAC